MADYRLVQDAYEAFFGLTARVGAVAVPIGRCAASLPAPPDLRRAVGIVAHAFSTPLGSVWEMLLRDLAEWADLARELLSPPR